MASIVRYVRALSVRNKNQFLAELTAYFPVYPKGKQNETFSVCLMKSMKQYNSKECKVGITDRAQFIITVALHSPFLWAYAVLSLAERSFMTSCDYPGARSGNNPGLLNPSPSQPQPRSLLHKHTHARTHTHLHTVAVACSCGWTASLGWLSERDHGHDTGVQTFRRSE
jgi:hypothetical protein